MRWKITILLALLIIGCGVIASRLYIKSIEPFSHSPGAARAAQGDIPQLTFTPRRISDEDIQITAMIFTPPPPPQIKPKQPARPMVEPPITAAPTPAPALKSPEISTPEPLPEPPPPPAPPPKLLGVIKEQGRAWALLSSNEHPQGLWVSVGEVFKDWTVQQIESHSAIVSKADREEKLLLIVQ